MLDRTLSECVDRAIARLPHACRDAPASAEALVAWTIRLSPTVRAVPDVRFQELVVESTVNAYYFLRIIDNLMDEEAAEERRLLPLLGILHANFSRAYARLFPADDPFWNHFDRYWSSTAEAAIREKRLTQVSLNDFTEIAARKTSGVKIPLAAVCCRYDSPGLLEPWCVFYDSFACWQQMLDDTFDWVRDLRHGNATFFLSEGHRQKRPGESVSGWVVRRGFAWAMSQLAAAMHDLRVQAERLESAELVRFLEYRDAEVREYARGLTEKLNGVAMIADVFEPVDNESSGAE
jgi:hypothetical protein